MLSPKDNDTLCRVGPGTAMGTLMREFWIPAFLSDELPEPDGAPLRIRLLSENLIAFRTTSGAVGLMQNACPHRGASMFFGRNEEDGLRCVYHGWKFDTEGTCVDMPNEPSESNFKHKIKAVAYHCAERNGVVWAYLGPRSTPPPLPDLEANLLPIAEYPGIANLALRECNYMQALEGDIDTVHSNFLHDGAVKLEWLQPGTHDYYRRVHLAPKFVVTDTDFGTLYGAQVPAEADSSYWRLACFLFPFYTMIPSGVLGAQIMVRAWVPIDDENTMAWTLNVRTAGNVRGDAAFRSPMRQAQIDRAAAKTGHGPQPHTSDWLGRWRLGADASNDYLIDRDMQKTDSYTGIPTIFLQDQAVTASMGAVYTRHREHLGTTDWMIIRTRRRLIQAAEAFRDRGVLPLGVDHPEVYRVRTGWTILPNGADWLEGTAALRSRFMEEPAKA